MPIRPQRTILLALLLHGALVGCQHASPQRESTRLTGETLIGEIHETRTMARVKESPSESASPTAAHLPETTLAMTANLWAESLIRIDAAGPVSTRSHDDGSARVSIPCVARVDSGRLTDWLDRMTTAFENAPVHRRSRLLMRSEAGGPNPLRTPDRPLRTRSPELALDCLDVPIGDESSLVGLIVAAGDHWGAPISRHELHRDTDLLPLLQAIDRPRSVRLLAIDAAGRVIHGVSLPLLPMAKSRPEAPQALLSPWWIRDRRTAPHDPVVWRNAAQWLAQGRTLATAARELPETVGDILFLPMLGWQSSIVASPWAVGGVEFDLTIELPSDVASRIDRFEFHLGEA